MHYVADVDKVRLSDQRKHPGKVSGELQVYFPGYLRPLAADGFKDISINKMDVTIIPVRLDEKNALRLEVINLILVADLQQSVFFVLSYSIEIFTSLI